MASEIIVLTVPHCDHVVAITTAFTGWCAWHFDLVTNLTIHTIVVHVTVTLL